MKIWVQLWCAPVPRLSLLAVHYWFVVNDKGRMERWEVWQTPDAGGTSWSHLHLNLKSPFDSVGVGGSRCEAQWNGPEAVSIAEVLRGSPQIYPYVTFYRKWPGPNSNTFVQWILDRAGIAHDLGPQGIGKDWLGWTGIKRVNGRIQFDSPLFGFRYRPGQRIELHLLTLSLAVLVKPLRWISLFGPTS